MDRIEISPRVCGGKPVIRGTRVPVAVILEQLAAGADWDAILGDYPELKPEDLRAALLYARDIIEHTEITSPAPA